MGERFDEDGHAWEPGSGDRASALLRFDPVHGGALRLINTPWAVEVVNVGTCCMADRSGASPGVARGAVSQLSARAHQESPRRVLALRA